MINEERLKRVGEWLFYIALIIEASLVILERSAYIIQYSGWWFRLTFLLFVLKVFITRYSSKELIAISICTVLAVVSYLCSGSNEVLRAAIMVFACKDMDMKKVFRYAFFVLEAGIGICMVLSFFGIGVFSVSADFRGKGITTRYSFGLGHANTLHGMIWVTMMYFLQAYKERIKYWHLAVLMVINLVLYYFTDSRTGLILISFMLVVAFILKAFPALLSSWLCKITSGIVILGTIPFSIWIMNRHNYYRGVSVLDSYITGRIMATFRASNYCEIASWLPFSAMGREPLSDIGIVKMIGWFGYIPALCYLILSIMLLIRLIREKDIFGYAVFITTALSLFVEAHLVSQYICTNIFFLILGGYWTKMVEPTEEPDRYVWDYIIGESKA